jgi:hypothetical protein
MKTMLCIVSFLLINTQIQFEIGKKLDKKVKIINYHKYILTSSASIEKAYVVEFNGCKYDVTLDTNSIVKTIFTTDKNFSTAVGIKVGMLYTNIKAKLVDKALYSKPGWAKYYISKSGWKVAFDYRYALTDSSKVVFIFKN